MSIPGLLLKFTFSVIVIFIVTMVLGFIAIHFVDANRHKETVLKVFKEATGQDLSVNGDMKLGFFPVPYAKLSEPVLNIKMADKELLFKAKTLHLQLDFLSLFKDVKVIDSFRMEDLSISGVSILSAQKPTIEMLSGTVKSSCCDLAFSKLKVKVADSVVTGDMKFEFVTDDNSVEANLKINTINYSAASKNTRPGKIFSNQKMDLSALSDLTGNINIDVGSINIDDLKLTDAKFKIELAKNKLKVKHQSIIANGKFNGNLQLTNLKSKNPAWIYDISLNNADASKVLKAFAPDMISTNGKLSYDSKGNSLGLSLAAIMANLSNRSYIYLHGMRFQHQPVPKSMLGAMVNSFNPLSKKKSQSVLECAILNAGATKGIIKINNNLAFESTEVVGLASGRVNLRTEQIDLDILLYPRNKSILGIGSFDSRVSIKGPFINPQVTAAPDGIVKEGGSVILGVVTGGLSLIGEQLIELVESDKSPCQELKR